MTTIVLADDHPIVRQGLRALLEKQSSYQVVGEASDGLEAVAMVERLKPDVLIVDVMMPGLNGLQVTRQVRERAERTRIIVLSMHTNESYVLEALRGGASGYVLKATAAASIVEAVRAALGGHRYLSPPLTDHVIEAYIRKAEEATNDVDGYKLLTAREREVFQLDAEGLSNGEISARLHISPRTTETHRTRILRKLGLRSRGELVRYAIKHGIIDL
ncbi:MAG TPA: response regulator transcription factor [Chloroflexia bacterium]|nr:response regulator transcription factor [Chloroflexia bacterium]